MIYYMQWNYIQIVEQFLLIIILGNDKDKWFILKIWQREQRWNILLKF
jgi:hypothetical protein